MNTIPPGYMTAERAQRIQVAAKAGILKIVERWGDRLLQRVPEMVGQSEKRIGEIMDQETATANREIEDLKELVAECIDEVEPQQCGDEADE